MSTPAAEPDGGALSIPAADGYHFADDHPWRASDQADLTDASWETVHHFREGTQSVPRFSSDAIA